MLRSSINYVLRRCRLSVSLIPEPGINPSDKSDDVTVWKALQNLSPDAPLSLIDSLTNVACAHRLVKPRYAELVKCSNDAIQDLIRQCQLDRSVDAGTLSKLMVNLHLRGMYDSLDEERLLMMYAFGLVTAEQISNDFSRSHASCQFVMWANAMQRAVELHAKTGSK